MMCNNLRGFSLGVVSPTPSPQAGGPPPARCLRLLIQYILTFPPYLEAVSFISNLRMHHAVVTGDPLNMVHVYLINLCFSSQRSRLKEGEIERPRSICTMCRSHGTLSHDLQSYAVYDM
jgi:hypothetical protein